MSEAVIECIQALKEGRGILLSDDQDREDEVDVVFLADTVRSEHIAFMMENCHGLICLAMTEEKREQLKLPLQVSVNESVFGTNFAMPFSSKNVPLDGITASGRATSILEAMRVDATPDDFRVPGCVVPVVARNGGVLTRRGQTEGSVDLARLAGSTPAAIICEVLDEHGTVLRGKSVRAFAATHSMPICSVEDLVQYRLQQESSIRKVTDLVTEEVALLRNKIVKKIPDSISVEVHVFVDDVDGSEHFAVLFGPKEYPSLPVRVHSECLTGDVFGSLRCDCGEQLEYSVNYFSEHGSGALLYLQQEGRGIGLANKLKAYELQDQGYDTIEANRLLGFDADVRDYRVAAQMLKILGISSIKLLTNNPLKIEALEHNGIEVISRIPIQTSIHQENHDYLKVKAEKMGHLLEIPFKTSKL